VIGVISLIPISHGPTTTTISIAHHLATSRSCGKRYDHRLILCYNILFILFARLVVLITFLAVLSILSRTCVPWLLKLMISLSSQTNELYQLASVAFCLLVAWCSDKLGLSLELGSFAAGVMIATTDLAQHTLEQIEPIRNFFAALFLASIGMLIHVQFLWHHVDILLASVILVIIIKTIIISTVVKGFGYNNKTSLLVGMSLAQIGEFAFVLLSRASNLHLVEGKVYLLLLGTTALSLV
jgi:Kef-type K+ transport system membrane component KefB